MPLDLSDEVLGLPAGSLTKNGNGLDLSDEALGLPSSSLESREEKVARGRSSSAPGLDRISDEFLALTEGLYGLGTQSFAALKGIFKGGIAATAGLSFGEVFREEFDSTVENAADAFKPFAPEGETLVHKMGELISAGVQNAGGFVFEKGLPLPAPFIPLQQAGVIKGPFAGSPTAAAAAETATFAALLATPFGRRPGAKPALGAKPAPQGPLGIWDDFAAKYPESAKSIDGSSLGAVRFRRQDTSVADAVSRQMDTELGLSGEASNLPFRTKAAMVFDKVAPTVPLGEKLRAVQALEGKINILDAARLDLSQRRGLPAPSTLEGPITVSDKGVAITPRQSLELAEQFKRGTVTENADALGLSIIGQLRGQLQNVLKHPEDSPQRTIENAALKQMFKQAFPDENFRFTRRNDALEKFVNFNGELTYPQVLDALGPLKKAEAKFFRRGEGGIPFRRGQSGAIDIEGLDLLLNSFKDLPNQPVLKRATIVGQLNRQGVPQAEKDVVLRALRDKDTITQAELVGSVAADILPLKAREFDLHNLPDVAGDLTKGLERVGGLVKKGDGWATTDTARMWQMPFKTDMPNHFVDLGSRDYFAHTRGFDKQSVRHIAEIQSDMITKIPKPGKRRVVDPTLDEVYDLKRRDLVTIEKVRPLEKRWYERILMEENRQASRDGMRTMRMATADTMAKANLWIRGPGEKLSPAHQGIYNFYKQEVASFTRSRFGAREIVDEFNNTWMEWPVRAEDAHAKIPAFGGRSPAGIGGSTVGPRGRQRGAIDIPEFEDVIRAKERGVAAVERAAERGWVTPAAADDTLQTKVTTAFEKSRAAEEAGRKITMESMAKNARRQFVEHDFDLRSELARAGEYGQKAVDRLALQNGATMAAKTRMDAVNDAIFNGLDTATKQQLDELVRLRRIIEIDSYKGVGKHKHAEGITGPEAEAVAIRMKQDLGDAQFARVYDLSNRVFKEWKDVLNRRFENGLLSEESYLKLIHFDYSPIEFMNLLDPLQTFTVHGRPMTVRTSGVPFLERGKRGAVVMDSQLLLAEGLVRSENLIFKNETMKALHELATKATENPVVRLPGKGMIGKEGTPDAFVKHTPEGFVALGVRQQGRQDFVLMREDLAEQFIRRPQVMSEFVSTVARLGSGSALVKATATTYNPAFIVAGLPMDILHTWLATSRVYSPHLPKFAGQMGADLAATAKDAWTRGPQYKQALLEGLGSSFMTHEGRGLTGITDKTVSVAEKQMMPRFDRTKLALSFVNESADIWVRMAHRNRLIRQGMDSSQATAQARNRLDYSTGGPATRAIDTVFPYTNVAVRALAKAAQAAKRDPADLATKLAWFGGAATAWTMANMIASPETWKQMPTDVKLRWMSITFGDQWFILDPDGNKRYIYGNGIRLDAVVEPVVATIVAGLEQAEYGRPPDDIISKSLRNLNPVFGFAAPPTIEAISTYFSNFDAFTGRPITPDFGRVRPENEGRSFGSGEPPSAIARAIGGVTGASPPRLDAAARKVMNTNNLYLSMMGSAYKQVFEGTDPRVMAESTEQMLLRNPGVRPFLRLTNPSTQFLRDVGGKRMEEGSRRKQMADSVDDLLFQVRKGQANLNQVKTYIRNQPGEDREWLTNYATTGHHVKEIMSRFGASAGIPNETWWRALSTLEPRPRAQEFYSQWLGADADDRRRMEAIARGLDRAGTGFYSDSFKRELAKERELLGAEQR